MHVINAMNLGGAEMVVLEHVRHAAPDIETHVCAVNEGGWALDEAKRLGARTFVLGKQGGRLGAIGRLARAMREAGIHVANGHNPSGGFYATLAGRWARVPVVLRTEHSIRHPGKHAGAYASIVEPALTAMTDRVICVCEAVRRSQAERMGWAASRFTVILNGIRAAPIEVGREQARAQLGLSQAAPVALTVASMTPAKAQHVLLDAWAQTAQAVPTARLLFAGDGPLRPSLEAQIERLGIGGRVDLLGVRKDVPVLLAAADVFVLSSEREGLSMSVLEAMRAGRAAVVTDVGGNGEAVAHAETGLVVPPGDPAALGAALATVLSDSERASLWGRAARSRWEESFTADHMTRDTEMLYHLELSRRSANQG